MVCHIYILYYDQKSKKNFKNFSYFIVIYHLVDIGRHFKMLSFFFLNCIHIITFLNTILPTNIYLIYRYV